LTLLNDAISDEELCSNAFNQNAIEAYEKVGKINEYFNHALS
jgi:hypothetical protein